MRTSRPPCSYGGRALFEASTLPHFVARAGKNTRRGVANLVWLSTEANPTTTRRVFAARHTTVRSLKATIGDQTYLLTAHVDADQIRSVVVVNAGQRIAYTAAQLAPRASPGSPSSRRTRLFEGGENTLRLADAYRSLTPAAAPA